MAEHYIGKNIGGKNIGGKISAALSAVGLSAGASCRRLIPSENGEVMEEEEAFLRRIVVRLRGVSLLSSPREVQIILKDVITEAEDRLDAIEDAKLYDRNNIE